ncbi:PTS sugar transporter subunit IIB [Enterococcus sp. LJL120]
MIKMLRVDERLVHGQVAVAWSKVLGITHLVVVNNRVFENDLQKSTLKMAVPENVKFIVKDVAGGITLLNDSRTETMSLMVVVENFQDALELAKHVKNIELINVGNYGLLPINQKSGEQTELAPAVRVSKVDESIIKEIAQLDIPFVAQLTPDSNKKNLKK